jgi:hypothetical protein
MDEAMLIRLSMVVTIIGICSLTYVLITQPLSEYSKILSEKDESIHLIGNITSIRTLEKGYMVTLSYNEEVSFYLDQDHTRNIRVGQRVNMTGKVSIYKGKKGISVEKIEKLNSKQSKPLNTTNLSII